MQRFILYRLATIGTLAVYQRGAWARRERLPLYLVSNLATGRDLEEFRRLKSALRWASAQKEGRTEP